MLFPIFPILESKIFDTIESNTPIALAKNNDNVRLIFYESAMFGDYKATYLEEDDPTKKHFRSPRSYKINKIKRIKNDYYFWPMKNTLPIKKETAEALIDITFEVLWNWEKYKPQSVTNQKIYLDGGSYLAKGTINKNWAEIHFDSRSLMPDKFMMADEPYRKGPVLRRFIKATYIMESLFESDNEEQRLYFRKCVSELHSLLFNPEISPNLLSEDCLEEETIKTQIK